VSDDSVAYTGPVKGIEWQYITATTNSLAITAKSPNSFIHTGSGTDAIDVSKVNGTNVLDGSTGSNFLVGGSGFDTFFVDDRGPTADVFSTVVGFHSGDNATVFGVTPTDFTLNILDGQGAVGFTGVDFGFSAPGKANANLVLTGFTKADLSNGRLTTSFGTTAAVGGVPGSTFMLIHAN
jgi:serralysin